MRIPLFKIYHDSKDVESITSSIKRGMQWAAGPNIEKFETLISKKVGRKYTVVFNSGTSALHALLLAYNIKSGDEVIVPSFSFIATANTPLFVGAKPVFADIEKLTYGLDIEDVKRKITNKTKAIMPMHYGGAVSLHINELRALAKEHKLLLIEDAAESYGAKLNGKKAGTFGDAAMFSFCQTKVFTTGEGGCIVLDSKDIYEKLKLIRSHGRVETKEYFNSGEYMDYVSLGYNFRMADCLASLGISQLQKVNKIIKIRREKAKYFTSILLKTNTSEIIIPNFPNNLFHVYQEYHIKINSGKNKRDELKKYLWKKGIGTRISFLPIHKTHFYKNILRYNNILKNTEYISEQTLTLPLYPDLKKTEMDYIAKEIKNFFS